MLGNYKYIIFIFFVLTGKQRNTHMHTQSNALSCVWETSPAVSLDISVCECVAGCGFIWTAGIHIFCNAYASVWCLRHEEFQQEISFINNTIIFE